MAGSGKGTGDTDVFIQQYIQHRQEQREKLGLYTKYKQEQLVGVNC